jgi:hypothetical protein
VAVVAVEMRQWWQVVGGDVAVTGCVSVDKLAPG